MPEHRERVVIALGLREWPRECSGSRPAPTACTQGSRGRGPSQWVAGVRLLLSQAGRIYQRQSGQPAQGWRTGPTTGLFTTVAAAREVWENSRAVRCCPSDSSSSAPQSEMAAGPVPRAVSLGTGRRASEKTGLGPEK